MDDLDLDLADLVSVAESTEHSAFSRFYQKLGCADKLEFLTAMAKTYFPLFILILVIVYWIIGLYSYAVGGGFIPEMKKK